MRAVSFGRTFQVSSKEIPNQWGRSRLLLAWGALAAVGALAQVPQAQAGSLPASEQVCLESYSIRSEGLIQALQESGDQFSNWVDRKMVDSLAREILIGSGQNPAEFKKLSGPLHTVLEEARETGWARAVEAEVGTLQAGDLKKFENYQDSDAQMAKLVANTLKGTTLAKFLELSSSGALELGSKSSRVKMLAIIDAHAAEFAAQLDRRQLFEIVDAARYYSE